MYLKNKNIGVVGGGLVGSLLSVILRNQGAIVSVFDKREDIRMDKSSAGRSINLALSNRGLRALSLINATDSILDISSPMYKRIMHSIEGDLTEQPYGKKNQAIFSVSRHTLNVKLIEIAESNGVKFFFSKQCRDINFLKTELFFQDDTSLKFDYVFGADGAGSVIRKKIDSYFDDVVISEEFIDSGYKELTIPANLHSGYKITNNALHIWPRKSFMIIALPNQDGTFTCTLFAPMQGPNSFSELCNKEDVEIFFKKYFGDLFKLAPNIPREFFQNPTSPLGFVRCSSWKKNNTILLGDASHATVPFYGQGMNAGFEDCFLLNQWINKHHGLSHQKIHHFLEKRRIDTMAMQDLSLANFNEMQYKTANSTFLLQKKIEAWFSNKHPGQWIPLYSMVTFSHLRYSMALKKGLLQDEIIKKIMLENQLIDNFNIDELEAKQIEKQIIQAINNS